MLPRRKIIHVETSTLYQLKSEVARTTKHVDDLKSKFGDFKERLISNNPSLHFCRLCLHTQVTSLIKKAPQVSRKLLPEHLKADSICYMLIFAS